MQELPSKRRRQLLVDSFLGACHEPNLQRAHAILETGGCPTLGGLGPLLEYLSLPCVPSPSSFASKEGGDPHVYTRFYCLPPISRRTALLALRGAFVSSSSSRLALFPQGALASLLISLANDDVALRSHILSGNAKDSYPGDMQPVHADHGRSSLLCSSGFFLPSCESILGRRTSSVAESATAPSRQWKDSESNQGAEFDEWCGPIVLRLLTQVNCDASSMVSHLQIRAEEQSSAWGGGSDNEEYWSAKKCTEAAAAALGKKLGEAMLLPRGGWWTHPLHWEPQESLTDAAWAEGASPLELPPLVEQPLSSSESAISKDNEHSRPPCPPSQEVEVHNEPTAPTLRLELPAHLAADMSQVAPRLAALDRLGAPALAAPSAKATLAAAVALLRRAATVESGPGALWLACGGNVGGGTVSLELSIRSDAVMAAVVKKIVDDLDRESLAVVFATVLLKKVRAKSELADLCPDFS